jgi:hypothetical protein
MIVEKVYALTEQMVTGVATIDAVITIGIYQLTKILIGLY